MAVSWAPIAPWHWVVTLAGFATALLLLSRFVIDRGEAFGTTLVRRLAVVGTSLLAIALLTAAAWNPVRTHEPDPGVVHLAIVLDVSDSVQRADGGLKQVRAITRDFLEQSLAQLEPALVKQGEASIITFRTGVTVKSSTLATLLSDFSDFDLATGNGSDIGAGLERAARKISESGGRGAILLVSDGHNTTGSVIAKTEAVARLGIPITVLPIESGDPDLAISSADLPAQVNADSETLLRGVLFNQTGDVVTARLQIELNAQLASDIPQLSQAVAQRLGPTDIGDQQYARVRYPLVFEGVGLQYVDLTLESNSGREHHRRFFTHVNRPVELLVVGGEFAWVNAISPELIRITTMDVGEFSAETDLTPYDGMVLSSVSAESLDTAAMNYIVDAIENGIGFMLINGDHDGAHEEAPSILRTFHQTALDPILPISTEPRPLTAVPPTRHVVILLDTSGSMGGWQLQKALETIDFIIRNHLTEQDFLDLIIFGGFHHIQERKMNDMGKAFALQKLQSVPSGNSSMSEALELLRGRELENCGLVVISDGEISGGSFRPECRTTVFAVNQGVPANSPLFDFADPFVVDRNFSPDSIQIPYFEPEPRDKFFEPGEFTPLSLEAVATGMLPMPPLTLDGTAISYARDGAEVFGYRPKFVDPILAYRAHGAGYVGAFMTGLPNAWLMDADAQTALQAWLLHIVPYAARDRYTFELADDGQSLNLQLALQNEDGTLPRVDSVDVSIQLGDMTSPGRVETTDEAAFDILFSQLPRSDEAQLGTLIVVETGQDELPRPQQIPILVPATGTVDTANTTEAGSFGINQPLLATIAAESGGEYHPQDGAQFFRQTVDIEIVQAYWPQLVFIAATLYLVAIYLRRTDY